MFNCDLLWRQSKVMFFTSENEEDYHKAENSDWDCIYSMELKDPEELIQRIKG